MTMNALRDLVELGLDAELFQTPLPLVLLGRGRTYHGAPMCGAPIGAPAPTKKVRIVNVGPLDVDYLCVLCWTTALQKLPNAKLLEETYYVADELRVIEATLDKYQDHPRQVQIEHLRELLRKVESCGEDFDGIRLWQERLRATLQERMVPHLEYYQAESTRILLLAQCAAATSESTALQLLEFEGSQGLYTHYSARDVVHDFWKAYIHHKTHNTTVEEVTEAFGTALVQHASCNEVDPRRLGFLPRSAPAPGETLENYLLREWKNSVASHADEFVRLWQKKWQGPKTTTFHLLVVAKTALVLSSQSYNFNERTDLAQEAVECWRLDEKYAYVVVRVPSELVGFLKATLPPGGASDAVLLQKSDTPDTLETALSLWTPGTSSKLGSLKSAVEAARAL